MVNFSTTQLTPVEQKDMVFGLVDRTKGLEAMHKALFDSHVLVKKSQERIAKEFTFEKTHLTTDFDVITENVLQAREHIFSLGNHLRTCVTRHEFEDFMTRVDNMRFEEHITKQELRDIFDSFEKEFLN